MEEGRIFSDYVNRIRKKKNISMQLLCEGLCTIQDIYYMESGSKNLNFLLQEIILERLGVGAEDYEHFLARDEYMRWKERQRILHSITFEKFEEAAIFLERYDKKYIAGKEKNKLEKQFYLSMLAQIKQCQGGEKEKIHEILEEAICLTVPMYEKKSIEGMVLSIKELNLMLEAERYRKQGERYKYYKQIVDYIEKACFDSTGKTKIYPKAVYFLCRSMMKKRGSEEEKSDQYIKKILKYCNSAIETLRDNGRMYFLWELLTMKEILLERYINFLTHQDGKEEKEKVGILISVYQNNRGWIQALEKVYEEFRVPRETFEYCYIYVCKGVYCINDVIGTRREMLGISQAELCEGICDVKTLRRLEKGKTSPHKAIVRDLFERLGLSRELSRTELETSSQEAKELMEETRELSNDYRIEDAEKIFFRLKQLISMETPINRQVLLRKEAFFEWEKNKISNDEYYYKVKKALEQTLPYENFIKEGKKYLTIEEESCIQNMMKAMEYNSDEMLLCLSHFEKIYQTYIDENMQETVSGRYEFIMGQAGSMWGDMGYYDKADQYSGQIMEGCLRFRRLRALQDGLYDRWWNYSERRKKGIDTEKVLDDVQELTACLLLSRLAKLKYSESFFKRKIETIEEKL